MTADVEGEEKGKAAARGKLQRTTLVPCEEQWPSLLLRLTSAAPDSSLSIANEEMRNSFLTTNFTSRANGPQTKLCMSNEVLTCQKGPGTKLTTI